MSPTSPVTDPEDRVRLDRWLVASRLYKTRPIAQAQCAGGLVKLNGERADSGKQVKVGDVVEAPRGDRRLVWKIVALEVRRGPASAAQLLYEDLSPPVAPVVPVETREHGIGRPTKREGREIRRLKAWTGDEP